MLRRERETHRESVQISYDTLDGRWVTVCSVAVAVARSSTYVSRGIKGKEKEEVRFLIRTRNDSQGRIQGGFVGFGRTPPPQRHRCSEKKFNGVRFGDIGD